MRRQSICNLKKSHFIDFKNGICQKRCKGDKLVRFKFSFDLMKELKEYLEKREEDSDYIFVS